MAEKKADEPPKPPDWLRSIVSPLNTDEYPHEVLPLIPENTRLYEYDPSLNLKQKIWALCAIFGMVMIIAAIARQLMLEWIAVPGTVNMTPVDPNLIELLGFVGSTTVVWVGGHEAIHAVVCRWYGWKYRVIFTNWGTPGIVPYQALQTRRETAIMVLAPVIVITIACVGFIGIASLFSWTLSPYTVTGALLICTFNLGSSAIDGYTVWKLRYLPAGSLLYTTNYRTLVAVPITH